MTSMMAPPIKPGFQIDRLFEGRPLIAPTENWWESGVTFNASSVYLEPLEVNHAAIKALLGEDDFSNYPEGIVALHYRARPKEDPGRPWTRSYVGVSIHHPDLTPIKRFETPVVEPGGLDRQADDQGVEDPRVTWFEGKWWMVYCGVSLTGLVDPENLWIGTICTAWSEDLVNWHKCGALVGDDSAFARRAQLSLVNNKDGVFLPDRIDGKLVLFHRPMGGEMGDWGTHIAWSDSPHGHFEDLGLVRKAVRSPAYERSWSGAGSVPLRIAPGIYLSIEHTGNYLKELNRKYVLDLFIYDFNNWDPSRPDSLVRARYDDFLRPETEFETRSPYHDSVANVVFACGSYVHDGWLYIVYGGGDTYTLGARVRFEDLVSTLMDPSFRSDSDQISAIDLVSISPLVDDLDGGTIDREKVLVE